MKKAYLAITTDTLFSFVVASR